MNLTEILSNYSLTNDEIEAALRMLDFTLLDIACMGQTRNRFVDLLRKYNRYTTSPSQIQNTKPNTGFPEPSDPNLMRLREQYNLDAIAGRCAEVDQLRNLMHWVHSLAIHTSNAVQPEKMNSLNLLHLIHTEGKHINCGMFATILSDVYLALGWKSRIIHLKPYQKDFLESHVVNAVYCRQLAKWLFFDPNLNAYFMDERGEILGVAEIRQRLIEGAVLRVNNELALNSDNKVFATLGKHFGKDFYRFYITKNIFRYNYAQFNFFDPGSELDRKVYIELLPIGYHPKYPSQPQAMTNNHQIIYTTNVIRFWQQP